MPFGKRFSAFCNKGYATVSARKFTFHLPCSTGLMRKIEPNVLTYLREKKIDLVINIPKNLSQGELQNDYSIRRNAIDFNIPLITNARLASAFLYGVCKEKPGRFLL